jgi:lysozyme family protein
MAEFNPALEKVLSHEGGYVVDPNDPGGETYKGVARKIHSKWDGWGRT